MSEGGTANTNTRNWRDHGYRGAPATLDGIWSNDEMCGPDGDCGWLEDDDCQLKGKNNNQWTALAYKHYADVGGCNKGFIDNDTLCAITCPIGYEATHQKQSSDPRKGETGMS